MSRNSYPVRITLGGVERIYSVDDQNKHEGWQNVLAHAHGKALVQCCCANESLQNNNRLSVHYRMDRYHLARFPESGHQHAPDCIFYAEDASHSGAGAYRADVIEELADGAVKVKLKVGLQRLVRDEITDMPAPPPAGTPRPGKSAMTLLGLLNYIWTSAGLNVWTPGMSGKRNVGLVHYQVLNAATRIIAGRTRLADALLVAASSPGKMSDRNASIALRAVDARRRLVIVTSLATYRPELEQAIHKGRLPISGFLGMPFLRLQTGFWEYVEKKFHAIGAWRQGSRCVAIIQTDVPRLTGNTISADVLDMAAMRATQDWLPVESSFEALIADKLVTEGRRFEKPCRFDSEEKTFPDFWLSDVGQEYPMEVWGLDTPEYEARKVEKTNLYNEKYGPTGWWGWDAVHAAVVPSFPPPA